MKNRLLVTSAICGLSIFAVTPAFATCDIHAPGNNATVTCSVAGGTDNTSVSAVGSSGVTVNIDPNAAMATGNQLYIMLGNNATVNVGAGATLSAPSADGMYVGSNSLIDIGAGASLSSGNNAIDLAGTGSTVTIGSGASVGRISYNSGSAGTMAISVDGTLTGVSTNNLGTLTMTLLSGYDVTAPVNATTGAGDTLILGGATNASFNTGNIGTTYNNFDTFEKSGSSTWTLTGANAVDWHVTDGTLKTATTSNVGNVNIDNGATFNLDATGNATYAHNVSGTGTFSITNGSLLTLSGDNSGFTGTMNIDINNSVYVNSANNLGHASEIDINQSTLNFTDAMSADSDFVIGANDATFMAGAGDVTLTGDISGASGRLIKTGGSNLVLSGNNTFGDGLTITGGRVTAMSAASAGTGTVTDNHEFVLWINSGTETFNNVIAGSGDFIKFGNGKLILGGANTLANNVWISTGTLIVDGTFNAAQNFFVLTGGTLGGSGTVRDTTVNSGAYFAPGNDSVATINVNGVLTLSAGSHYAVDYSNAGADKTIASNTIAIDNAAILDLTGTGASGTYGLTQTYTIMHAANITGTFGTVNNNLAFLDASLNYSATDVDLTLARNNVDFRVPTTNSSQSGAAGAAQDLGAGNALYDAFSGLTDDQVPAAAESISGAGNVSILPTVSVTMTNPVMTHVTMAGAGVATGNTQTAQAQNADPSVYVAAYMEPAAGSGPVDDGISVWMQAIGSMGHTLADAQTPGQHRSAFGAVGGIDRVLADGGLFGVYGGYQRGEVSSNAVGASADLNSYMLGAYVSHPVGSGFALSGGVSGMYHDIDTVRHVIVGGAEFSPHGDTHGETLTAYAELARPMHWGDADVTAFGDLSITRNHMNGYSEHDGGAANLVVGDTTQTNPATTLGLRGNHQMGAVTVSSALGWQHTFGDLDPDATMHFASGTTEFSSIGTPIARDAAVVSLGVSTPFSGGHAFAGYDGTLARDAQDHSFKAGLKWAF